ncbi:putative 4-diphosphocytidyl-2-C-methyl-D-erythritol kinase [subsurface metagenome]
MINTREAYRWLDEEKQPLQSAPDPGRLKAQVKQDFLEKPVGCWNFKNSFQTVAERRFPEIGTITKRLKGFGAVQAGISGSGSAVIGFYPDRYRAERAKDALKGSHPLVTTLRPLATMPSAGLE